MSLEKFYSACFYLLSTGMFVLSAIWWAIVLLAGMATLESSGGSSQGDGMAVLLGGAVISTQILTACALTAASSLLWIIGNLEESLSIKKKEQKKNG